MKDWSVSVDRVAVAAPDSTPGGGNIVCCAPEGFPASMENWPARARLIAAAPDLLEALKPFAAIALLHDMHPNAPDMLDAPDLAITPAQVRAARAAILKAEGK